MGRAVTSSTSRDSATEQQLGWLAAMHEIRAFEDTCHRMFTRGLVRGSTHLGQGQEAVAVGACSALRVTDAMACTYRGHAAVLAKGAPLDRAFGEILGRARGLCGGKGGSMHLTDMSVGAIGSFAIVGAHLPIAVGVAVAAQYTGSDDVSLCFFGDGSTNIGAFHESMNLASTWSLPVIFVCENNLYGEYSPIAATTATDSLRDRAAAYQMTSLQIDGNDVANVHTTVSEAVARARAGEGPTFIEALTYRQKGHSRSDPGAYRPEGELERWLERDPITLLERVLEGAGVAADRLTQIRQEAETAVQQALARAEQWPEPGPESLYEDILG